MELLKEILFWMGLLLTVIGVVDAIYNIVGGKHIKDIIISMRPRIPFYLGAILIVISIWIIGEINTRKLYPPEPFEDNYLALKIPSMFAGPFYNSEPYDLELMLTNKTNDIIYLSAIGAKFYNPRVSAELKVLDITKKEHFYTSIFEDPGLLLPKDSDTLTLRGPYFIPQKIEIIIYHSGSEKDTKCEFIVSRNRDVSNLFPKQFSFYAVNLGIEGLYAINEAFKFAKHWSTNVRLVNCMPGSHSTYLLPNGLCRQQIDEWIVVFKNNLEQGIVVSVNEAAVKSIADFSDASDFPDYMDLIEVGRVKMGTAEALRLANNLKLIYEDSFIGWGLFSVKDRNGLIIPIWRLPYIGSNYLNIYINAENGNLLPAEEYYEYCKFPRGSVTSIKEEKEEDE